MKRLDRRFLTIVSKWTALAIVTVALWILKVFHLLFVLLLLLIQEFWRFIGWLSAPTKMGAKAYWSEYWTYWAAAYVGLMVAFLLWYFLWYRNKRPVLEIGGGREGRVVWVKGLRRGLVYDVWDAKNYVAWKLKKNRLAKIPRRISAIPSGVGAASSTWPDPLAIPLGRQTSERIIYYSRPWGLRLHTLTIPNRTDLRSSFNKIQIPEGYIINRPDPFRPGEIERVFIQDRPGHRTYVRGRMRQDLLSLLNATKDAVQRSAAANPQLIHRDYEDGSFPLLDPREVEVRD